MPFATILRIRPGFLAQPHTTPMSPWASPLTSQFSFFLLTRWKSQRAPVSPPPALTDTKCSPRHDFPRSECPVPVPGAARRWATHSRAQRLPALTGWTWRGTWEAPSCVAQRCFFPWSTVAKFPWPCAQGPWARAVGVGGAGSLRAPNRKGFHVGASCTPGPSLGRGRA